MKKFFLAFVFFASIFYFRAAEGKIYIDITSPERRVPIAIQPLAGPEGTDISEIVNADLDFTDLFILLDPKGATERPEEKFRRENWLPAGVICVMKGKVVSIKNEIEANVTLYDVETGSEIYKKKYRAPKTLIRPLAHSIADDIYKELTGSKGAFKSKLAYVLERGGLKDIVIADWDGERARQLDLKEKTLLGPRWSKQKEANEIFYSAERSRRWAIYSLDLDTMKEKTVFNKPGTNLAGDINRNGDLAFSSSFGGTQNIYILTKEGFLLRLTNSTGIQVSPSFSPDGKRLVFVSDQGGNPQIYMMDANGYNISRFSFGGNYNTSPSWSPDGERITFAGRYEGRNQIFIARRDGSEIIMLTSSGNNEEPSFSQDGRFIVFSSDRNGYKAIYMMRATGGAQKRISPYGLKAFGPQWSMNN